MRRTPICPVVLLVFVTICCTVVVAQDPLPALPASDTEIRRILLERIETYKKSVGIVVGVVTAQGTQIVSYGAYDDQDKRIPSGASVFEIGSVSKVFTSLLLADMVQRGEVKLEDPVAKYLPGNVHVPTRNGKEITLLDLAMHVSGLPRMPSNFTPKDSTNPYSDYTVQQMYDFISNYQLGRDIGEKYEYSNLGVGLLGHALALRAGTDYETLLSERILKPLSMNSTGIVLSADMRAHLVPGHNDMLKRVSNWDIPTLAGAGAIRSTMNDMLNFLAANMGLSSSALSPAMKAMLSKRRPAASDVEIAVGWHILNRFGEETVWHNGGTGGYHSFIGFDPKRKIGVVVLSNSANDIDDIGRHLINARYELAKLRVTKEHKEISVDPNLYERVLGVYELTPAFKITITSDGDRLYEQATGQARLQLHPESPTEYFLKEVDAQITFEMDDKGQARQLILHQGGMNQVARRVSTIVPLRKAMTVAPNVSAAYVGKYQLAPNFLLTITAEQGGLYLQATGQPRFEMLAESVTEWFLKDVDAQFTFVIDGGKVSQLILHQNGADIPARRVD